MPRAHCTLPVLMLAKKETWRFLRYWNDALVEPVVSTLLYLGVFGMVMELNHPGVHYREYLAPGLVLLALAINCFDSPAYSLLQAKMEGNIVDILMPPFSGLEITLGYLAGALMRGVAVTATVLVIESFFIPFPPIRWPLFIPLVLLIGAFFGMLGMMAAVASDSWDNLISIVTYCLTPLVFLSSAFFLLSQLEGTVQTLVSLNPVTWQVEALRSAMTGHATELTFAGIGFLIAGNLIMLAVCCRVFGRGWRLRS